MTAPENPPRWAPDPLGLHQYRYWNGAEWTEHVADDGKNSIDPLTATEPVASTGAAVPAPVPGTAASVWSAAASVPRHDPTAILGRRYGAFLIDAAICIAAFLPLPLSVRDREDAGRDVAAPRLSPLGRRLLARRVRQPRRAPARRHRDEADVGLFIGLSVLFTFLYFAVIEGFTGGSLGKHLTGLRVVTPTGNHIGLPKSMARWAASAVDGPLSFFLCGIITSSVSQGHRRLGDMAACMYVVGRDDAGREVVVP